MDECRDWIEQYLDIDTAHRRRRAVQVLAKTIYPTPWGRLGKPNKSGERRIVKGQPDTAMGYAEAALKAIEKDAIRG